MNNILEINPKTIIGKKIKIGIIKNELCQAINKDKADELKKELHILENETTQQPNLFKSKLNYIYD